MKQKVILVIVLLTAAIFIGCSKKQPAHTPPAGKETNTADQPQQPKRAPESEPKAEPSPESAPKQPAQLGQKAAALEGLTIIKGSPVTTFEKGRVYVVEFWATWCGPCKRSIPHLTEVQKNFSDKNVTVIGISREKVETVKPFVEEMGDSMDYTVAVDPKGTATENYMKAFGRGGIPTAFIVNGDGNVVWVGHPAADIETSLDQIIAGTFDMEGYMAKMEEARKQKELRAQQMKEKKAALDKKIEGITALLEKDPENVSLLVVRAQTYLGDSFTKELAYRPQYLIKAVEDYKKASELDPDNTSITEQLEFFDAWNDRTEEKVNKLKAFVEKYPDSVRVPFAMYSLQYFAAKEKNYSDAIKYITMIEGCETVDSSFRDAMTGRKAMYEAAMKVETDSPSN